MKTGDPTRVQLQTLQRWLDAVTYRPGWAFSLQQQGSSLLLCAARTVQNSRRPDSEVVVTGRIPLGEASASDRDAFWSRLRQLIGHMELHEVDEWLICDGVRVFDPHVPVTQSD